MAKKTKNTDDPLNYRVKIDMTARQARLVIDVLDMFTRIGIGQFEDLARIIDELFPGEERRTLTENILYVLKKEVAGCPTNGNWGIAHPKVNEKAKMAYDLLKSLQKVVATAENHDGWSVWHDGSLLHLSGDNAPKVSFVRDGVETDVSVER